MHMCVMQIPYAYGDHFLANPRIAYGDQGDSPCAYGDLHHPHMHTGIDETIITVCIWGLVNPCTHTGSDLDPHMHTGIMCMLIPVCKWESPSSLYAYGECS